MFVGSLAGSWYKGWHTDSRDRFTIRNRSGSNQKRVPTQSWKNVGSHDRGRHVRRLQANAARHCSRQLEPLDRLLWCNRLVRGEVRRSLVFAVAGSVADFISIEPSSLKSVWYSCCLLLELVAGLWQLSHDGVAVLACTLPDGSYLPLRSFISMHCINAL